MMLTKKFNWIKYLHATAVYMHWPDSEFYDRVDGDLSMGFGGLKGRGAKKQDPRVERELALSLEEIFNGCTKKMKISRRVRWRPMISFMYLPSAIITICFPISIGIQITPNGIWVAVTFLVNIIFCIVMMIMMMNVDNDCCSWYIKHDDWWWLKYEMSGEPCRLRVM